MAIYNLAHGGYAAEFNQGCKDCGNLDQYGLPLFLQPDKRADGGYGFLDKREWKNLLRTLEVRYQKSAEDLNEGDELIIFLQPNHSNVKSLFVDLREKTTGFKFYFKTLNGTDLSGREKIADYSEKLEVQGVSDVVSFDTATAAERTQWTTLVENGYNAKVDAIVLKIEALPQAGIENAVILFARRFEQEGYMM